MTACVSVLAHCVCIFSIIGSNLLGNIFTNNVMCIMFIQTIFIVCVSVCMLVYVVFGEDRCGVLQSAF